MPIYTNSFGTAMSRENGDPYENLANAIILMAANDYRSSLIAYKNTHGLTRRKESYYSLRSERMFFTSDWFAILSGANGDVIAQMLEKEILGDDYQAISKPSKFVESKNQDAQDRN